MRFAQIMAMEEHGSDVFVGVGPRYPWGGLYGGQIVAQGLRAAACTVEADRPVHSLHAYFIRMGDADAPIRYEVDRIRDGRSFATRRVVARQANGAILNLSASFTTPDKGPQVQTARAPELPEPETLPSDGWSPVFDRRMVRGYPDSGRVAAWLRMNDPIHDETTHAAALAYLSDDLPTDAVVAVHPDRPADESGEWSFWNASLDHSIWFHRPFRADEWHVHDVTCHGLLGSRGLSVGHVFGADGRHVATLTQEVLLRPVRPGRA